MQSMTTAPQLPPRAAPAERSAPPASRAGYAKSRDTRARILAAALEEAGASGIHGTSMAGIAARAGVAVGSLSYHFGSRAELIRELMGQLMADYLERVRDAEAAAAEAGGDYFARERAVLLAYVAHVRRHPAYVRLADEIKLHEPELYRRGAGAWTERMAGRIRAGIAEGVLRPMSEAEIALKASFLLGARHSLEQVVESDASLSDEALVDAYLDLVREGLGRGAIRGGREAACRPSREAS
jgi:AcrR family transcriptional regulator